MIHTADASGLLMRPIAADVDSLRRLAYRDPDNFPVLLDSAASGSLGRYSILAAYPTTAIWQDAHGTLHGSASGGGFLEALQAAWRAERTSACAADQARAGAAHDMPFRGGWMVYLGYEIAAEVEPGLKLPGLKPGCASDSAPAAFALRTAAGAIYDHGSSQMWLFAEAQQAGRLAQLAQAIAALPEPASAQQQRAIEPTAIEEEDPVHFRRRVEAGLDYIRAGEVYQANLSRPWRGEYAADHTTAQIVASLYERLRSVNPAPFAALAQFQDWRLLSCSPERLVRVSGTRVETRPIAGTRARSGIGGEHDSEVTGLITHPKERAEHVMLIDLERNDLGRICRAGTVRADEFMVIESYPHVHHIVSNICGEPLPDLTPVQVLRAVFPGGTITGCPKFRCMQIIAELEREPRGAYTGALGYINLDGSMDFNILIRSLTLHQGRVAFRTGAGIVADSQWERELAETRAKARGVLRALGRVQ
jgi:anthranilate synthase component I